VDGKWVYFANAGGLWKVPAGGGKEGRVMESIHSPNSFRIMEEGVYFISGGWQENLPHKIRMKAIIPSSSRFLWRIGSR